MSLQIALNQGSDVPIWVQLRTRILHAIASGTLQPGDQLPTVRELAAQANVNYNTVSKVYQDLERDGYIISQRGRGSFVADLGEFVPVSAISPVDAAAHDFISACAEHSLTAEETRALLEKHLGALEKAKAAEEAHRGRRRGSAHG